MNKEEELQNRAESGGNDKNIDLLAYQKVFRALKTDLPSGLPDRFADRVVNMLAQRESSRTSRLEISLAILGGTFSIIVFIVAIVLSGFKPELGFLKSAASFKGILLFGAGFIILLNWLEKFLLRKKDVV